MIVKRELLSTSLVKEIQHRISTNQFAPGDRLPSQDELAAMFGVSRTALREALKQLSLMGLVEVIHGKGTFVRSFTPSALLESLFPQPLMDKKATFDLLEARMHIESAVAFLAAKRADPDDLRELEILVNGMQQDSLENNAESFVEKDLDFHLVVAKASKNPFLAQVLQTIRDMLHKFIIVSGIGCTAWIPSPFFNADVLHTTHGRPIAFGFGIKMGFLEKKVMVVSGDGDLVVIGGNHLMQNARRNVEMVVLCVNNGIYGMTGGQAAPTTPMGIRTTTTPLWYGGKYHQYLHAGRSCRSFLRRLLDNVYRN